MLSLKQIVVCACLFVPLLMVYSCDDSVPVVQGTATSSGNGNTGGAGNNGGHGGVASTSTSSSSSAGSAGFGGVASSSSSGTGGEAASSGSGGGDASPPSKPAWGQGPGKPGKVSEVAHGLPFVQGMASQKLVFAMSGGSKCADAGAEDAGADEEDSGPITKCPSSYAPKSPVFNLSAINETSIQLSLPILPVFQPIDFGSKCELSKQLIANGSVFIGDCTGELTEVSVFTEDDLSGFFGLNNPLPQNTNFNLNGHPVSVITGLAVKSAVCGHKLYVLTNASTKIVEVNMVDPDAGYPRTDYEVGAIGLSGLMCGENGTVLFSTARTFTVESWNTAASGQNPSALVEADPIYIKSLDPVQNSVKTLAEINGGSRILSQNSTPIGKKPGDAFFIAGVANMLALAVDGDVLFGDHLAGSVWKVSLKNNKATQLFTTDRLFTGMVQAPNGVIFLGLNAVASAACDWIKANPKIAFYDENSNSVKDWMVLDHPDYQVILPALCTTGVIERDYPNKRIFLGGGNFNDLAADAEANLFVTETARHATTAIAVVYPVEELDAGLDADSGD